MRLSTWNARCYFEAQYMRLTTWRTRCYFEAQVWKRDSSIAPFYYYFFLFWAFPLFFGLFLAFLCFPFLWNNALLLMIITLLFIYNSILEQDMTLYECLRRCTGMVQWSRVTCMKNNAWWLCHKYNVNYMIMQWQYDKSNVCHDDDDGSCMAIYLGMAMEMP